MRPDCDSFSFLLHWLFRFPESNMEEIAALIIKAAGNGTDIVNHVMGQAMHLHAQWHSPCKELPSPLLSPAETFKLSKRY
jgi:hypothetical protein